MSDLNDPFEQNPTHDNYGYMPPENPTTSALAVTGLILGLVGMCIPLLGIVALILGIIALTQIADPRRALTGRGMALTATILGAISTVLLPFTFLLLGILLPALGAARRAAMQMKNTTQLRGITQGMVTYASGNRDFYPGLNRQGYTDDLSVENRYRLLLDNNIFSSDYIISPAETKILWTTGQVTADNYSYSMLQVPEIGGRCAEWRQTMNGYAIVISDRNTGPSSVDQDVMSIHTNAPGDWTGSVGRNDGSASYEQYHKLETKYGSGQINQYDNIFEEVSHEDAMMIYEGN